MSEKDQVVSPGKLSVPLNGFIKHLNVLNRVAPFRVLELVKEDFIRFVQIQLFDPDHRLFETLTG